jgi:iron complex transport system substrate-binding protein
LKVNSGTPFIRGDANGDSKVTVADVVNMINYLYKGGPAPSPLEKADTNCDGSVNVADVIYLINYLFKGGPPPC